MDVKWCARYHPFGWVCGPFRSQDEAQRWVSFQNAQESYGYWFVDRWARSKPNEGETWT